MPASFVAAARELRVLAMRFPASAAPLAQGAFAWDVPPLRAGGEAAVARALCAWTERTSEAADSALFASMGLWISPFTVRLFAAGALIFTFLVLAQVADGFYKIHPGNWTGNLSTAFGFAVVAVLLRADRREAARWAYAATCVVVAACWAAEAALSSCKCWGPYAETHTGGGVPATRARSGGDERRIHRAGHGHSTSRAARRSSRASSSDESTASSSRSSYSAAK